MGIPVGRSFEIAYAQLRMLFFLCRDVRRMAVQNRLCSASDAILSLPGCASDGRSKSLKLSCGCYCSLPGCA